MAEVWNIWSKTPFSDIILCESQVYALLFLPLNTTDDDMIMALCSQLLMLKGTVSPSVLTGHLSFISLWLHLFPGVIAQIIHFSRILTPKQKVEGNSLTRSNPQGCFLWL